jgi:hypothetical protein
VNTNPARGPAISVLCALSKTYGQMWLRCDVCRRYARLKLAGLRDVDYRANLTAPASAYCPRFIPSRPRVYSENGPGLVATDLIAASVMAAAFRAESGFSRRPLDPPAA